MGGAVASVSALVSGSSDYARVPALVRREHCVVFLGKTRNSHSGSLHSGV